MKEHVYPIHAFFCIISNITKEVNMTQNNEEICIELLEKRGVKIEDIAKCALHLQKKYHPEVTLDECIDIVHSVIAKREVQHAILTGLQLDMLADSKVEMVGNLKELLNTDEGLFGIDEVLAYGICNLYGSIALTNYGYIDKEKPCIIGVLNEQKDQCNCFLDDIVGAIAAAVASKIAHNS